MAVIYGLSNGVASCLIALYDSLGHAPTAGFFKCEYSYVVQHIEISHLIYCIACSHCDD